MKINSKDLVSHPLEDEARDTRHGECLVCGKPLAHIFNDHCECTERKSDGNWSYKNVKSYKFNSNINFSDINSNMKKECKSKFEEISSALEIIFNPKRNINTYY